MPRPRLAHSKAGREIEHRAYHRAADLAKDYAEHWERGATDHALASLKAVHWRILENPRLQVIP